MNGMCVSHSISYRLALFITGENDGSAFEAAYQIIVEASQNGFMPAQEIFNIARHMEHRGIGARAFKVYINFQVFLIFCQLKQFVTKLIFLVGPARTR